MTLRLFLFAGLLALSALPARACPDFTLSAVEAYRATGQMLRTPRSFMVLAGGNRFLGDCPGIRPATDQGDAFFTVQPDFSFHLDGMAGLQLEISVLSDCDSALLVNTPGETWFFDDDDNGDYDARILLTRPRDGRTDIWVGTFDGSVCAARLTLASRAP